MDPIVYTFFRRRRCFLFLLFKLVFFFFLHSIYYVRAYTIIRVQNFLRYYHIYTRTPYTVAVVKRVHSSICLLHVTRSLMEEDLKTAGTCKSNHVRHLRRKEIQNWRVPLARTDYGKKVHSRSSYSNANASKTIWATRRQYLFSRPTAYGVT